jgi:hypothetical protein
MPLQILRPEDIPAVSHARVGIVAQNGVGKTTWASTIPAKDARGVEHRVLYASVDIENLRPVLRHKHYRPVKLSLWNDLLELYELVDSSTRSKTPVTDVVFDTWSRMQDLAVGKVTGYNPTDPAKLREYIDRIPKRPSGWEGWGQVGSLMNEWMANFNRLPVSTYFLLQEMNREEKFDESLDTGPRLTPEAARGLKDALEIIGRMYVEFEGEEVVQIENLTATPDAHNRRIDADAKEVRKLLIGKHERFFAKGPTHLLGRVIENPTWNNTVLPVLTQTPRPELTSKNGTEKAGDSLLVTA